MNNQFTGFVFEAIKTQITQEIIMIFNRPSGSNSNLLIRRSDEATSASVQGNPIAARVNAEASVVFSRMPVTISESLNSNPPFSSQLVDSTQGNATVDRTNTVLANVFAEKSILIPQTSNTDINLSEISRIKQELDAWGITQKADNQKNVKTAKHRILKCYEDRKNELDLSRLNLSSIPINVLGKLDNLKELDISYNHLTAFEGTGLTNLRVLYLSDNQLISFNGNGLVNLSELRLSDNKLTSLDGSGLNNLEFLDLSENQLISLNKAGLNKLKMLYLSCNKLSEFDGTELYNLENLDLSENQLTSFIGIGLNNLRKLYISNNQLTLFDRTGLPNLRDLDLSHNQLTSFVGTGLNNLRKLYLSNNHLTSFDGTGLANLRYLSLSDNQLTSFIGLNLINLISLGIWNNLNLAELPFSLGLCRHLTDIDINNTSIPESLVISILINCAALRRTSSAVDLPLKIQLWQTFAGIDSDFGFVRDLKKEDAAIIYEWLTRLERSADFKTNQTKLAKVVCNILKDLQSKDFKVLALTQMQVNNERCEDRAAMALNELYLSWQICCNSQTLDDKEKLKLLTRAGKTLALRNAIAKQLKGRPALAESVETYLYYEIALAKDLNLLTCIENMFYPSCSQNLDVNALKKYTEENYLKETADLPILDEFLKANDEIQDQLYEINEKAFEGLNSLKEPQKLEKESFEDFKNRKLEWEFNSGTVKRKRELEISKIKINYLKKALTEL